MQSFLLGEIISLFQTEMIHVEDRFKRIVASLDLDLQSYKDDMQLKIVVPYWWSLKKSEMHLQFTILIDFQYSHTT